MPTALLEPIGGGVHFQDVDVVRDAIEQGAVSCSEPKISVHSSKDKFLFAGRIWVDAADFAVTKVDGQPAVNPSWWTKSTNFSRVYEHIGAFWLPESNHSVTRVRIFGTAVLTITYRDYRILPPPAVPTVSDQPEGVSGTTFHSTVVPDAAMAPYKSLARDPNPWTWYADAFFQGAAEVP